LGEATLGEATLGEATLAGAAFICGLTGAGALACGFAGGSALACGFAAGFFVTFAGVTALALCADLGATLFCAGLLAGFLTCLGVFVATLPFTCLEAGFFGAALRTDVGVGFLTVFFAAGFVGRADLRGVTFPGRVALRRVSPCFEGFVAGLAYVVALLTIIRSSLGAGRADLHNLPLYQPETIIGR
jgi:hypothetical protein